MIGFQEILFILLIVVLLFGASNIPKLAKSIGEGLKEFKKGVKEAKEIGEDKNTNKEENKSS